MPASGAARIVPQTPLAQGDAGGQGLLWEPLCDDEGSLATLDPARHVLFRDEDFELLYATGRGRPSQAPSGRLSTRAHVRVVGRR